MRPLATLLLSLLIGVSLAHATTREQWNQLHNDQREAYVTGAVDMWRLLLILELDDTAAADHFIHRLNACLATHHLSTHELTDIVDKYGRTHRESSGTNVAALVITSLEDFCGLHAPT